MHSISSDSQFLKETLKLAKRGMSWTFPNPLVGAVVVKNGKIIAKGYHKRVGEPHAEIEAISASKQDIAGSTLYINLEPCLHHGRTPPCIDAIIQAGIKRVVCTTLDPNPKVNGNGITKLKQASIDIVIGVLEKEARELNEAFFTFHEKKRPFIALKFAASLDGKIATRSSDSHWITNERARAFARTLRTHYQAVLVGINTILTDNPHLGVRVRGMKDPLRIVLDTKLRIPLESQALRDTNVLVVTTGLANKQKIRELAKRGVTILPFSDNKIPISALLEELRKREIVSILVEGGGKTLGSFVDERLVDKVYAFHAPLIIGGEHAVSAIEGRGVINVKAALKLSRVTCKRFDDNMLTIGYIP